MGREAFLDLSRLSDIVTIEIACPAHGVYRAELTQEQEQYACPACASPCRATIIIFVMG